MSVTLRTFSFSTDTRGTAAVELALVFPLLATILFGIISYGGYFWTAHNLQQLANDSARAALAGLDADERAQLAGAAFNEEIGAYQELKPTAAKLAVTDAGDVIGVSITYDASTSPFWAFRAWLPMPSAIVVRAAVVREGGY
jgi:Flp pilus assembly protein TadG